MSKAKFIKHTKALSEEELREEISLLYSKLNEVKTYYAMELGNDDDRKKIYDKAKAEIKNLYYIRGKPRRRPRIQKIKTKLKELEKLAVFTHETIDVNLYTCDISMTYLSRRPSTTQASYNNCKDTFSTALNLIQKTALYSEFKDRCQKLVEDAMAVYDLELVFAEMYKEAFDNA